MRQTDRQLADELVRRGRLTPEEAEQYLREAQASGEAFKAQVIRLGKATDREVMEAMAAVWKLPVVELQACPVAPEVIEKVPVRFALYFKFMPIRIEGKTLTVASAEPIDVKVHDEIRVHLGLEPQVMLARESDILEAQNRYYGLAADTIDRLTKDGKLSGAQDKPAETWVEDLEKSGDEASVGKLVNEILLEAYKKRATDIHIEPYRSKVRVRYRIDGVLTDANIPPAVRQFLPSIISRIKIMANLSIVERRVPQDGSAVVKTKERDLDLRVSTIPTPWGESMVIRILPGDTSLLTLEKLGLEPGHLRLLRSLLKKPHGIILVTGPTGSGKTTTLYACLQEINAPTTKIITLEDPLEYEMEGITQIQVNTKVNLDFAAGLRSILRHDPDIIMVGEIRDHETAEIAIRTALTGHLVFSTLHTNDAASGVTRLIDMGLEPFLVGSSIEAFMAQRLVRIICPKCREEVRTPLLEVREEMARALGLNDPQAAKIFQGRGCDHCHQTGYYGRTALYEILLIDEAIRTAILEKRRSDDIKHLAVKNGMRTMRQDGWQKVFSGVTTPSEVMNVTARDEEPAAEAAASAVFVPPVTAAAVRMVSPDVLEAPNAYDDGRVYPRLRHRVRIRYAIVRQDPHDPKKLLTEPIEHSSVTKDISAGGLRFVSGYTLSVGSILDLKIQLEEGGRSVDCLAKICRVEEDHLSAMFHLVAYYLDISSADRQRLEHFVNAGLSERKTP